MTWRAPRLHWHECCMCGAIHDAMIRKNRAAYRKFCPQCFFDVETSYAESTIFIGITYPGPWLEEQHLRYGIAWGVDE